MATGPKGAITPLELLENNEIFKESFLAKWFNPIAAAALAFSGVIVGNFATKRPVMSGIQKHIGLTTAAFFIIKYVDDRKALYMAERDAAYRHYIELHPDDFPPIEQKQFKDILEPWYPIRT